MVLAFSSRIAYEHNTMSIRHTLDPSTNVHAVYEIWVLNGSKSSKGSDESVPMRRHTRAFDARLYKV